MIILVTNGFKAEAFHLSFLEMTIRKIKIVNNNNYYYYSMKLQWATKVVETLLENDTFGY